MKESLRVAGKSVKQIDGLSLATGRAKFAGDLELPGMLVAKLLTSPHAHARIRSIDTTEARRLPGVVCILTHDDLPRVPHTTAGEGFPETSPLDSYVLDKKVRFVGDRVAAVAAETRDVAEQACRLIDVTYDLLPAVLDIEHATDEDAAKIHDERESLRIADADHNVAAEMEFQSGTNFFERADFVFDRTYVTQFAQHCPIEPHVTVAYLDEQDRIVIQSSSQVPFHARRVVAKSLRIPLKRIRVINPQVGGGFGAKQEVGNEPIVAALALATRRPVKLEFTRPEEMLSSRTRHPMIVHLRSGLMKDGTITDFDMDVLSNTGAYGSRALTFASSSGLVLPLYRARNVKLSAKAVYTNMPAGGAARGGGAMQGSFAMECLIDEMAERLGRDPLEFRKQNQIQEGDVSPVFKALSPRRDLHAQSIASSGLARCIDLGAQAMDWAEKRARPKGKGPLKRGVGAACLMDGSGTLAADLGSASLKLNEDGSFNLSMGATGCGAQTLLAQIAAEVLGVRESDIVVHTADTDVTPFDAGLSTTFASGMAVKKAAEICKEQILQVAGKLQEVDATGSILQDGMVILPNGRRVTLAEIALQSLYILDQVQIQGSSCHVGQSPAPSFAAHFCEVEVDEETGKVTVLSYVAAVDCGAALNPKLAEGETEGAVLHGISNALVEEIGFDSRGRPRNSSWLHYKIFDSEDAPPLTTILVDTWEPAGPFGAKSVSEISMNGPMPAIANAIYHAIGIRMREAPFTGEKVLKAISLRAKGRRLE